MEHTPAKIQNMVFAFLGLSALSVALGSGLVNPFGLFLAVIGFLALVAAFRPNSGALFLLYCGVSVLSVLLALYLIVGGLQGGRSMYLPNPVKDIVSGLSGVSFVVALFFHYKTLFAGSVTAFRWACLCISIMAVLSAIPELLNPGRVPIGMRSLVFALIPLSYVVLPSNVGLGIVALSLFVWRAVDILDVIERIETVQLQNIQMSDMMYLIPAGSILFSIAVFLDIYRIHLLRRGG